MTAEVQQRQNGHRGVDIYIENEVKVQRSRNLNSIGIVGGRSFSRGATNRWAPCFFYVLKVLLALVLKMKSVEWSQSKGVGLD